MLNAVGSTQAFIMGTSESGAAAALMASMFASRVRGLILFGASPFIGGTGSEFPWNPDHGEWPPLTVPEAQQWGDSWQIERFAPARAADHDFQAWWSRLLRAATSPSAVATVLGNARAIDIRSLLPAIQTPTLIIHRVGDRLIPVSAGRYFAAALPQARFVELPGSDHVYFINHEALIDEVASFMQRRLDVEEVRTWLAIILCMSGTRVALNDATRSILDAHGAKHLRHSDTAWTALFDGPTPALRAAHALRNLGREADGGMSLHVGACSVSDGVPVGAAYSRSLNTANSAKPGDILITGTLRDILAGADVTMAVHSIAQLATTHWRRRLRGCCRANTPKTSPPNQGARTTRRHDEVLVHTAHHEPQPRGHHAPHTSPTDQDGTHAERHNVRHRVQRRRHCAPDYTGPVTITIAQALTGQTTSAGTFTMTGARADNGSTTEEITFGGPLTTSPVPVTFVRTMTGKPGTLTVKGSATLTFSSQTAAVLAGSWTVERGTGASANTTGSGSLVGSADFGATPPTGALTYSGSVAR